MLSILQNPRLPNENGDTILRISSTILLSARSLRALAPVLPLQRLEGILAMEEREYRSFLDAIAAVQSRTIWRGYRIVVLEVIPIPLRHNHGQHQVQIGTSQNRRSERVETENLMRVTRRQVPLIPTRQTKQYVIRVWSACDRNNVSNS